MLILTSIEEEETLYITVTCDTYNTYKYKTNTISIFNGLEELELLLHSIIISQ